MRDLAQGEVRMEAVVLPNGSIGPVRITQSLHRDLDSAAVAALTKWKFRPATVNGRAVAVVVAVEMTFTLK